MSRTVRGRRKVSALPLIAVIVGGALTGFSGILLRYSEIGPVATGAWRLFIGALAFAPLALFMYAKDGAHLRPSPTLALAGMFFALDIGYFHVALGLTSVAHATLIAHLSPVLVITAGVFLFGERLSAARLVGAALALSGTMMMSAARAQSGDTVAGDALAAISMVSYSLYLLAVKRARRQHNTLSIMLWSSATSALCMFGAALILGETIVPNSLSGWLVVLAMGLIIHVGGQGLIAYGMRETPVSLSSIVLLMPPVVAAVAAWLLFDEDLTAPEIVGAVIVLAGLTLASRSRM